MESKCSLSHRELDRKTAFLFGFCWQPVLRRFRKMAATLDSYVAGGRAGVFSKSIHHGRGGMHTQILSFAWRRAKCTTSISLLPASLHAHLAAGRAKRPKAKYTLASYSTRDRMPHLWLVKYEVINWRSLKASILRVAVMKSSDFR